MMDPWKNIGDIARENLKNLARMKNDYHEFSSHPQKLLTAGKDAPPFDPIAYHASQIGEYHLKNPFWYCNNNDEHE